MKTPPTPAPFPPNVSQSVQEPENVQDGKQVPAQSPAGHVAELRSLANWIEDNVAEISDASMDLIWKRVHAAEKNPLLVAPSPEQKMPPRVFADLELWDWTSSNMSADPSYTAYVPEAALHAARKEAEEARAGLESIRAVIEPFSRTHYECEDCFYSCPMHPNYCGDREDKCECGTEQFLIALAMLDELSKKARTPAPSQPASGAGEGEHGK